MSQPKYFQVDLKTSNQTMGLFLEIFKKATGFLLGFLFCSYLSSKQEKRRLTEELDKQQHDLKEFQKRQFDRDVGNLDDVRARLQQFVRKE